MNYSSEVGNAEEIIANGNKKPQSRDFKCPCGKTYLSYAALFTHIKQKHDGKVITVATLGSRLNRKAQDIKQAKRETSTCSQEQVDYPRER